MLAILATFDLTAYRTLKLGCAMIKLTEEHCQECDKRLDCLGHQFCLKLYMVIAIDYTHRYLDEPALNLVFANSTADALLKVQVDDPEEAMAYTWDAWPINEINFVK